MRSKGITKVKLVQVEWMDAFSPDFVWVEADSLADPERIKGMSVVTSVGYLVHELEAGVWLAMCESGKKVGHVFFVPAGMIQSIKEIN